MTRPIRAGMRALALGFCLLALSSAGASAAAPVPEDFSAANQYVESVPTSEGSKPAGPSSVGKVDLPLRPEAAGGENLEQLATAPELGAPRERLHGARGDEPDVPSALVSAIGEDGGGSLLPLVIGLLLVSGVVAGTAGHRHYRNRQTAGSA